MRRDTKGVVGREGGVQKGCLAVNVLDEWGQQGVREGVGVGLV